MLLCGLDNKNPEIIMNHKNYRYLTDKYVLKYIVIISDCSHFFDINVLRMTAY